ncbi:hypothetical protein ACFX1X_014286 [Malus domestica]
MVTLDGSNEGIVLSRSKNGGGSLLEGAHIYINVEKAEDVMQKMRDLGFARTPLSYNILLNLYYQMETLTDSMF